MRKHWLLSLLALSFLLIEEAQSQVNYSFFTYQSEKELGSKGFNKQDEWDKFRNKYEMNRIDEVVTPTEYTLQVECSSILNIGLCLTGESFDQVKIKSLLKTVLKNEDKLSDEYLGALNEEVKNLLKTQAGKIKFIDLRQLFIKAYRMKADSLAGCCPDKMKDLDLELREKLCSVAEFHHGLEITLSGKTESKTFGLRTIWTKRTRSSNEQVPTLEPRQYVTIYEREKNKEATKPIWWLVKKDDDLKKDLSTVGKNSNEYKAKFYTSQKHRVVDKESILEIKFDQEALAKNINFYGNISLAAKIGNRSIEVSPYSLVGKPQKSYGVNSKPILEIADNFFRLMLEVKNTEEAGALVLKDIEKLKRDKLSSEVNKEISKKTFDFNYEKLKLIVAKIERENMLSGSTKVPDLFFRNLEIKKSKNNSIDTSGLAKAKSIPDLTFNDLKSLDNSFTNEIDNYIITTNKSIDTYSIKNDSDLNRIKQSIFALSPLLKESDRNKLEFSLQNKMVRPSEIAELTPTTWVKEDIEVGFMRSLEKQAEDWADVVRNAEKAKKYMEYFKNTSESSESAFLRLLMVTEIDFSENYRVIKESLDYFATSSDKLSEDKNFNKYAKQLINAFKAIGENTFEFSRILSEYGYGNDFKKINDLKESLLENPEDYKKVRQRIALYAGQIIFSKLLYGTIDLKKQSVNDGDEIEISVMWYNIDETTTTAEQGVELATAKFLVKKTGWHLDVSESALLIHRIDEEKLRSGYPLSPSNFKPTAGASLLWSYYNPYRTERLKKTGKYKGQYRQYDFLKFLHWLEPSFGINVSYLDFRTDRDFEFGAGPVMGLFQNRIFLTTGYNFSVNGESPFYMGIGFSFSNIYKRINKADNE